MGQHAVFSLAALLLAGSCRENTGPDGKDIVIVWAAPRQSGGGDWIGGTPAVDGGRLFIQEGNTLAALDAETGKRLWTRRIRFAPYPGPSTLRAAGGRVYVSETDSLMAVDAATGTTIWNVHPDSQAIVETALDGDSFYSGQRGIPVVYALARSDGRIRWKVNLGPAYTLAANVQGVAVSGDTVYATLDRFLNSGGGLSTGVLVALDRRDGHELWRYETVAGKHFCRDAPVPAGRLVVANDVGSGDVVAIDIASRSEVWRTAVGAATHVSLSGAMLYTGGNRNAMGLDLATGTVRWSRETGSSSFGTGICGNSFISSAFALRRFDLLTGTPTGQTASEPGFVSHVASDGQRGYVTSEQGTVAFKCDP